MEYKNIPMVLHAFLIIITTFVLINFARAEVEEKNTWHIDHPDHIPHEQSHHGKHPVKKVFDDDLSFMRKKKKKAHLVTHETI